MNILIKLSRKEMKTVYGGKVGPSTCSATCANGKSVSCSGANCTAHDSDSTGNGWCSGGGQENNC